MKFLAATLVALLANVVESTEPFAMKFESKQLGADAIEVSFHLRLVVCTH